MRPRLLIDSDQHRRRVVLLALGGLLALSPLVREADFRPRPTMQGVCSRPHRVWRTPEGLVCAPTSLALRARFAPASARTSLWLGQKLDLNRAGAEDLTLIPGIGRKLARRIVVDREHHGPFRHWRDIYRIKGIGPRLAKRMAAYAEVPVAGRSAKR